MGIKVKRIGNKLYIAAAVAGLLVPMKAMAAQWDMVTLIQQEGEVAVSLDMSDAVEETITAVSVSLKVETGDSGQAAVDFIFSPELGDAEYGYNYVEESEGTGRLDIYAVTGSGVSLFGEEGLNLGNVKVTPTDTSRVLDVEISYRDGSFQTANAAYGDKIPVVEHATEPVKVQVGSGAVNDPAPVPTPGEGQEKPNPDTGEGSGGSGNDNRDEGLYDETTRYENDPDSAQNISSSVIKGDGRPAAPVDLSKGPAAQIAGIAPKPAAPASAAGQIKTGKKVTVIAPKDGLSSIFVSKADGASKAEDAFSTNPKAGAAEGFEKADGTSEEEIRLDQENGGVEGRQKKEGKGRLILAVCAAVVIVAILGVNLFLFLKRQRPERRRKRPGKPGSKKRRRKKRRLPNH